MEKELTARFDMDSKRYHRFSILEGTGITGSIYIPKGTDIPEKLVITLKTKADE